MSQSTSNALDATGSALQVPKQEEPATVAPPRTWLRRIVTGGQIVETCPVWCTADHENDRTGCLDDLVHAADEVAITVESFDRWAHGTAVMASVPILAARMQVDPYSEDPARSTPHVSFEPWQDEGVDSLDPDEFAALIARMRAHCDRLDEVHAQLVAARAAHRGEPTA